MSVDPIDALIFVQQETIRSTDKIKYPRNTKVEFGFYEIPKKVLSYLHNILFKYPCYMIYTTI